MPEERRSLSTTNTDYTQGNDISRLPSGRGQQESYALQDLSARWTRNDTSTEYLTPFEYPNQQANSAYQGQEEYEEQRPETWTSNSSHSSDTSSTGTLRPAHQTGDVSRHTDSHLDQESRQELSRVLTSLSQRSTGRVSVADPSDPAIDPTSDKFDLAKFLRSFRHYLEDEGVELKKLSVVYKNLDVYGSGAALQLQKTVSDLFMMPFRLGEYVSFGKNNRKRILHNFDGIIKAGELCVVLGRPGSGCSTLLKALTGELHGLDLGEESVIHYNGIKQSKIVKEFKGETVYNQEVMASHINLLGAMLKLRRLTSISRT